MNWANIIVLAALHVAAAMALFHFSWQALAVTAVIYITNGILGITAGYHRLLTHRSYQVSLPVEYFFAFCGTLALQGGPIFWVAKHRIHHRFSDQPGDPHSPRDGPWWAHMGWILVHHPDDDTASLSKHTPDLARHRFYLWLDRYHWLPNVVLGAALWWAGGLTLFLWAGCFRLVAGLHSTWLVNSATHMWGSRRFDTRDDSRNNWWVALLTFGEGWHNNHHAHPTSARHGLAWYEFDPSWLVIRALQAMGIATSVKVALVSPELRAVTEPRP